MPINHNLFVAVLHLLLTKHGIPFSGGKLENFAESVEQQQELSRFLFWGCTAICTPQEFLDYMDEAFNPPPSPASSIPAFAGTIANAMIVRGMELANANSLPLHLRVVKLPSP